MKIFVLGGTGGTGRQIIDQALGRGHHVTAFVRSPDKLGPAERLAIVAGDPRSTSDLRRALPGHDAVLTTLGGGMGRSTICRDAAVSTVAAMKACDVRRVVVVSGAVLFHGAGFVVWLARGTFLRNVAEDLGAMDRTFIQSELDWTIVRPPQLSDGPLTRRYGVAPDAMPQGKRVVSRADVAHCVLEAAEKKRFLHGIIGMAMPRAAEAAVSY